MNEPRTLAIVISVMSLILIVVPCVVVTLMIFHDRYKVFKNRYHSLQMELKFNRDERSRLMRENSELQNRVMELEEEFALVRKECGELAEQIDRKNNQLKRLETANGTLEHLRQTARDALSEIEHVADTCHLVVNRPSTPKVKESP